jgi:hypothetical protein
VHVRPSAGLDGISGPSAPSVSRPFESSPQTGVGFTGEKPTTLCGSRHRFLPSAHPLLGGQNRSLHRWGFVLIFYRHPCMQRRSLRPWPTQPVTRYR